VRSAEGFLAGIEKAAPEVQQRIRRLARWKALRTPPPVVVDPDAFVPDQEVRLLLHGRADFPKWRRLAPFGALQDAYRATDAAYGFTRETVEREHRWRGQASIAARLRREVRTLFGPVVGWWTYPPDL
jgi:hypothetical protein